MDGGARTAKRRLFKQTTSLKERLAEEATRLRKQAQGTGRGRDFRVQDVRDLTASRKIHRRLRERD